MQLGMIYVSNERLLKLGNTVKYFIDHITSGRLLFKARILASLIGKFISMHATMGNVVRLRTRSLYECLIKKATSDAPFCVDKITFDEIVFWSKNYVSQ